MKKARPRVARPHQHEDAGLGTASARQERLDGVAAEVGVDRERVGVPPRLGSAIERTAGERRVGVGGCRQRNVVAFAVQDRQEAEGTGLVQQALQHRHAGRAARLEERALRFDDGHDRRDEVEDAAAELLVGRGDGVERIGPVPGADGLRQRLPAWIEADAERGSLGALGVGEAIGKLGHFSNPLTFSRDQLCATHKHTNGLAKS